MVSEGHDTVFICVPGTRIDPDSTRFKASLNTAMRGWPRQAAVTLPVS